MSSVRRHDNDGDIDVVVADLDRPPQVLCNDGGNTNNAILIQTMGVKSNRSGIGARVKVVSGALVQTDEVRSGDSYLSPSDLRLHFRLERRKQFDLIEVRWPSGIVDKIAGVEVNKIVTRLAGGLMLGIIVHVGIQSNRPWYQLSGASHSGVNGPFQRSRLKIKLTFCL